MAGKGEQLRQGKEVRMTHRTMSATAAPVGPATPLDADGWAV